MGIAISADGKLVASTTMVLYKDNVDDGIKFANFLDAIQSIYDRVIFTDIAFEEVHAFTMAKQPAQARMWMGYRAHLMHWAYKHDVRTHAIPLTAVKKAVATAKAKKTDIIQAVRKLGHAVKGPDEADAVAVLYALSDQPTVDIDHGIVQSPPKKKRAPCKPKAQRSKKSATPPTPTASVATL